VKIAGFSKILFEKPLGEFSVLDQQ